jgi:DNA polymerase-3 subunit beta
MAVLTNILMEAGDDQLHIVATDLEVSLRQTVPAQVGRTGRAATAARTLFEIVRESVTQELSIESLDNHWVSVSGAGSRFRLAGVHPDEHPGMPSTSAAEGKRARVELAAVDLAEMIRKTVFAVSSDDTRANLAGVFFDKSPRKGVARMVATDGHRLAMIDRPVSGTFANHGVILPRKGVTEAAKVISDTASPVGLGIIGNEAVLETGDARLSMRLVEGTFPDYLKVVPADSPREVGVERDALLSALRRVAILSSERSRGVRLRFQGGKLEVSTNNPDMGEASEEISVEYDGGELAVGFNARYLLDVLAVLPEGSRLTVGLGDELSPGVIRGDDTDYTYVVMPMRV